MLPAGTLLGRYRVDALAAVGGMGAVYRGTDTVLERVVALKVLLADRAGDPGMAERFASESLQAAGLSHPHVLPVYDAGEADGVSYVAMQWVDGATLEQFVAEGGPLEVERAVALTEAIAGALDHAHDHGLVHRDVKPANVMVDAEGHPYLMDFGLSVRADRSSGLTRTGEFLATVDYAAPEQIEGAQVDRRADVYGLAGLAFRCLTGRVPFERETPVARLYAHLNDQPPVAHELCPAVPPAASETIRRALAKRAEDRPATAGAFAAELRAAVGGAPADTVHLAAVPEADAGEAVAAPAARPTRRVVAVAAATVLAAFGGMSLAGVTGGGAPSGEIPAADAGPREDGDGERATTQATAPAGTATTVEPAAGESQRKGKGKGKKDDRDRDGERAANPHDRARTGRDAHHAEQSTPPAGAPSTAAGATPEQTNATPAPGSATTSEPAPAQTTPTQTQTAPAQTTETQPAETTPTETTPAETTPTETTATEPASEG